MHRVQFHGTLGPQLVVGSDYKHVETITRACRRAHYERGESIALAGECIRALIVFCSAKLLTMLLLLLQGLREKVATAMVNARKDMAEFATGRFLPVSDGLMEVEVNLAHEET